MLVLRDRSLLEFYIKLHAIDRNFDRKDLNFQLLRYHAGEQIGSPDHPIKHFMFLVDGIVSIYALREDGSTYPVEQMKHGFLGDREFCGRPVNISAEAKTPATFVAISLEECQQKLWDDNRFLRLIIITFSDKLSGYVDLEATQQNFEDRLLYYIENECPNRELDNVADAIYRLRCSRRQIQRILKKLTDEGTLEHIGKGKYRLNY